MNKRVNSTFYFFQYLFSRIILLCLVCFLIYSIIAKDFGGIIFCLLAIILLGFGIKKQFYKPDDLHFDKDFIYLDNKESIEIKHIKSLENGVIIHDSKGKIVKTQLPNYYFIDKNFKKLKNIVKENKQ